MLLIFALISNLLFGQLCLIVCYIKGGDFHVLQLTIQIFLQIGFELEEKFISAISNVEKNSQLVILGQAC
jgi:hypothetical protein